MNHTSNYTNLDYLRLMADGDTDMEKMMLEMLIAELPEEFEKIKAAHEAQDWEELSAVSHKMKSTLAFVGNEGMTKANKEIEHLAKHKRDTHKIAGLIVDLGKDFQQVMAELEFALNDVQVKG